jgi:hypothetical protein
MSVKANSQARNPEMRFKKILFAFALLAYAACSCAQASDVQNIFIYYSAESPFQSGMANAIKQQLDTTSYGVNAKLETIFDPKKIHAKDLIISIGNHGDFDESIIRIENPVIYINNTVNHIASDFHNSIYSNIEITQPPCRYLNLIKTIDKHWENIGYLSASADDERIPALRKCAGKLGLNLVHVVADTDNLPNATDRLLRDSDVMLALPDNRIYNRRSVKNILLSAYRHRIPVIGFSDNFVRAGALSGVFSTPEQLARQTIELIKQYSSKSPSDIHLSYPPAYYSVSVNSQVAKSLDIDISEAPRIESVLQQMESTQ